MGGGSNKKNHAPRYSDFNGFGALLYATKRICVR